MKVEENRSVWFLWILMYHGHESWITLKLPIFVSFHVPESWRKLKYIIYVDFHVPEVMKVEENRGSDFCQFSCIRGHESWRKWKRLIFVNFQVHGVLSFYLIAQKWWLNRSKTKYKHFKGKKPVPWWPKNEPIKNLSPAVVVSGIKNLMLRVSLQSDHR